MGYLPCSVQFIIWLNFRMKGVYCLILRKKKKIIHDCIFLFSFYILLVERNKLVIKLVIYLLVPTFSNSKLSKIISGMHKRTPATLDFF